MSAMAVFLMGSGASADIEKIPPEFSAENKSLETDRSLENIKRGDFDKVPIDAALAPQGNIQIDKDVEKALEGSADGVKIDPNHGDGLSATDSQSDVSKGGDSLFPIGDGSGKSTVDKEGDPLVVYPEFKGKIKKEVLNQLELKKPTMGCTDLLMGNQIYSDPAVALAFSYVYTLCLMELSIQKYLLSESYLQSAARGLVTQGKEALRDLQKLLPSYLLGFKTLIEGFRDGHLREILDDARKKYQEKQGTIGL